MRIAGALLSIMALGSCGSASHDAERELEIVKQSGGDSGELCKAERKVADAYLAEHKQSEYERAKLTARIACRRASQEGL